ncbi:LuxR C-terminal-related transcriptional regulator [Undibacterium sp. Di26W]|uniref:helix-turn-helix transcriptional regulator n=1 Tax=Undibacterium sp. Di26W TaxID=3413035 RepID=UPI003BF11383
MNTTTAATTHSLREQYRDNQANQARLRLLHDVGRVLAEGEESAISAVLAYALEFSAFEACAVLVEDAGALRIHASKGPVLPHGTRFPAQGVLSAMLKPDARVMIRQKSISRLLLPAGDVAGLELLFPLMKQTRPQGILVLVNRKQLAEPSPADMLTLGTLANILALALHAPSDVRPQQMNDSVKQISALLTAREREVLSLLPHGLTNADIGDRLGIARGTVKIHVERIIQKLRLQDRTQVAALAVELGLGTSGTSGSAATRKS